MKVYLFKIPEKNYNISKYLLINDLDYVKDYITEIKEKKMYGILFQKYIIKKNYNIPYNEILIKRREYNKPYYNNIINYNLSYSKDYIIITYLYNNPVGIDIQYEDSNIKNVLTKYGNKSQILKNSIEDNTKIWTKIESYLKMIEYGLSKLDNIQILNNNILDKTNNKKLIQIDISNFLPDKIHGTITTYHKEKIFFNNINIEQIINVLDE